MSTWHMKVRVFRVPDCDTRITRTKFGFCKLLPEIPEQNSGFGYFGFGFGFGYSGFGFRVTGFLPSPTCSATLSLPLTEIGPLPWNCWHEASSSCKESHRPLATEPTWPCCHWWQQYLEMSRRTGLAGGPKPGTGLARHEPDMTRSEPGPCRPSPITGPCLGRRRGTTG
jgi:hypothetical protein